MKDNLRSENEKHVSKDTSCKQRKNLWDWVVQSQRFEWKIIDYFMSNV